MGLISITELVAWQAVTLDGNKKILTSYTLMYSSLAHIHAVHKFQGDHKHTMCNLTFPGVLILTY